MNNSDFLFNLSICFLLSFFIGMERQYRKRIIGLRTTILVSLGAFLFVTFSFSVGSLDLSRIASQVVTGIGFLGAGVILKDGKKIRGLTTAATLWCDAAIGILCAGGAIFEATLVRLLFYLLISFLRHINKLINNLSDTKNSLIKSKLSLTGREKEIVEIKKEIQEFLSGQNQVDITNINLKRNQKLITLTIDFSILKEDLVKFEKLIDEITEKSKLEKIELKKVNEIKPEDFDDEL